MWTAEEALHKAKIVTSLLYESDYAAIKTADVLHALAGDARLKRCARADLLGTPVVKLAAAQGLVASNGAAALLFLCHRRRVTDVRLQVLRATL